MAPPIAVPETQTENFTQIAKIIIDIFLVDYNVHSIFFTCDLSFCLIQQYFTYCVTWQYQNNLMYFSGGGGCHVQPNTVNS